MCMIGIIYPISTIIIAKGCHPVKKKCFLSGIARITSPLFLDVKNNVLARITEQSKDDYDNDVSDNYDHNFGTFDDFGVKNDQKVSNNMILMSKYKGKYGRKKGQKIRAGVSPPLFGQCPKENIFFSGGLP